MIAQQKKIYDWFKNSPDDARKALSDLLKAQGTSSDIRRYAELFLESVSDNTNEYSAYDTQCIRLLDQDIVAAADDLLSHLRLLAAATDNEPGMESYDEDALSDILSGDKKDYDERQYIHTLRQSIHAENRHNIALMVFLHVGNMDFVKPMSMTEALIRALQLDVLWKDFLNLPEEVQKVLLTRFAYQSIVMGVPVDMGIKDTLYMTTAAVEYFLLSQRLYEYLQANEEQIPLSLDGKTVKSFTELTATLSSQIGDKPSDSSTINGFARNLYASETLAHLRAWFSQAMNLYFAIKEARIVEKTLGGETSDADVYENEMKELVQYFFDPADWQKIAAYYKKSKPLVPLINFLNAFPKSIDLEKDVATSTLTKFSDFLHTQHLIPEDKEIIEFHEKDGKFHWGKDFVS